MKTFLTTCANIFQFTSGAKIATVIAIYLKFITPPTFPFFQAHWLLAIAVVEIIITLILSSGNLSGRCKLVCIYSLAWFFFVIHIVFHFAKIDACPCLGAISNYNGQVAILVRLGLFVTVLYMLVGSSLYLAYERNHSRD